MVARSAAARLACAIAIALLSVGPGCRDTGIVGEVEQELAPRADAGDCDSEGAECPIAECTSADDCDSGDEPYCAASECVECRGEDDCEGGDEPWCVAGECVECAVDPDCENDGEGTRVCEDGRCVEANDEEEDDSAESGGDAGESG